MESWFCNFQVQLEDCKIPAQCQISGMGLRVSASVGYRAQVLALLYFVPEISVPLP